MNKDFSRLGYSDIVALARSCGYDIRLMRDAYKVGAALTMLLRHDVDLSLRLAFEMAQIEYERQIAATYYILPHNDYYDPLSPEGRRILSKMVEMGHEIGLHCDAAIYPEETSGFHCAVRRDIEALEDITGCKIASASLHSPIDSRPVDLGGLVEVEAYAARVRDKFAYISDSAMSWRSATPWSQLPARKNLQLLTHPIWWMAPGTTRQEKFQYLKKDQAEQTGEKLDSTLAYIERCLVERDQLDARVARQWREPHDAETKKVTASGK